MKLMKRSIKAFVTVLLFSPALSIAAPYYGFNISLPLIKSEPPDLHGAQFMLNYDPQRFQWRKFDIYFDGGISQFWVNNTPYYTTMTIYSIAPIIRYTFDRLYCVSPYIEISIGLAYLNHTQFEHRNLGMHMAFQDRMGVGMFMGTTQQFSIGLHAVHYSNAHLASHNSGISIPLMLDLGYRFN